MRNLLALLVGLALALAAPAAAQSNLTLPQFGIDRSTHPNGPWVLYHRGLNGKQVAIGTIDPVNNLFSANVQIGGKAGVGVVESSPSGALLTSPIFDVVSLGAVADDATDNAPSFSSALTQAAAVNGAVHIPCGSYRFLTPLSVTIGAGGTLAIDGDAHGCVVLHFPASNGLQITKADQYANVLLENVTFVTDDTTGSYTGLSINQPAAVTYGKQTGQPAVLLENIQMRGSDAGLSTGGRMYWGLGYNLTNLTNVEIAKNSGFTGADPSNTATISNGSPAVLTMNNNFPVNAAIKLSTTGSLPTGLTAGTIYYVVNPTSTSFSLSATPDGPAIATSGSQSGTTTVASLGLGIAISVQGLTSPQSYSGQINIRGFQGWFCHKGFYYGDFVQGVTLTGGTNFSDCTYGVDAIRTPTGTPDQLVFSDGQIASYAAGINAPAMNGLLVHHSLFIIYGGTGLAGHGNHYVIDHNFLQNATGTTPGGIGINVTSGTLVGGIIDANHFDSINLPIEVTSNTYAFVTIEGNHIDNTSGSLWYSIAPGSIGVNLSDPTPMTVAQLNTRIPCAGGAVTGARAVVTDAASPTFMGALTGGSSYTTNAICRGAAAAWLAD